MKLSSEKTKQWIDKIDVNKSLGFINGVDWYNTNILLSIDSLPIVSSTPGRIALKVLKGKTFVAEFLYTKWSIWIGDFWIEAKNQLFVLFSPWFDGFLNKISFLAYAERSPKIFFVSWAKLKVGGRCFWAPMQVIPSNALSSAMDLNFDTFFLTISSQG